MQMVKNEVCRSYELHSMRDISVVKGTSKGIVGRYVFFIPWVFGISDFYRGLLLL